MFPQIPSEAQVAQYVKQYRNWGRWGKTDELGTLNLITPRKRKQAAALVEGSTTVSCSRLITTQIAPEVTNQALHYVLGSGEPFVNAAEVPGQIQGASDFIGLAFHGLAFTHLDSLCHVFWEGKMYNGFPSSQVTTREGALVESVDVAKSGVVSRGVLLDIPRLKKVKWLKGGVPVYRKHLESAEHAAGLTLEEGDILLVRTGNLRRRNEEGPRDLYVEGWPGLHANCIPFLHQRGVAALGTDTVADVSPSGYKRFRSPIHQIGIAAMGLWLIDNCDFEELSAVCTERNRWEFLLCLAPLRIQYGTGSPLNPIAVF